MENSRFSTDDAARFEHLYRSYYARVCGYFRRLGASHDDARDIAQDVFMRVYENFQSYRGEAEWSFLQVVAHRVFMNHLRNRHAARRRVREVSLDSDIFTSDPPGCNTPEIAVLEQEDQRTKRSALASAIAGLSPAVGSCLLLMLAGYNYSQIANHLRIAPDAVKSRLYTARRQLRHVLAEGGDSSTLTALDRLRGTLAGRVAA